MTLISHHTLLFLQDVSAMAVFLLPSEAEKSPNDEGSDYDEEEEACPKCLSTNHNNSFLSRPWLAQLKAAANPDTHVELTCYLWAETFDPNGLSLSRDGSQIARFILLQDELDRNNF